MQGRDPWRVEDVVSGTTKGRGHGETKGKFRASFSCPREKGESPSASLRADLRAARITGLCPHRWAEGKRGLSQVRVDGLTPEVP